MERRDTMVEGGNRLGAPLADEATRAKAAVNVERLCPDDAEEMLDALGLAPKAPATRTARSFACPTCAAAAGTPCRDSNSTSMGRCHVARNKLLRKATDG